ncbi:MAG: AraC family transcriptional regulator, partial [Bacteroidales bacterium]|nr:AraC family transcriptional regulator [Bacteroidales bacterium]
KYADKEHSPSFYSNQMCISTQYLSLILKEATGKTATEMIATEIIARAKALLRTPGTTIVQVVDALNFADQSTFGKFFKKNTGITPKKYQESYASPK